MAKKTLKETQENRDTIFADTGAKKKATGENAKSTTTAKSTGGGGGTGPGSGVDKFMVLKTLLKNHEAEVLYRKAKEDRMLVMGLFLVALLTIGAFVTRAAAGGAGCGWFYCLVYRSFFAGVIGVAGFSAAAMIELNRTRLQDLLAMIVKLHESFELFTEGAFGPGSYLPNTYKFIGSINDDETNYSLLVLKVGSVVAALGTFLLV